MTNFTKSDLANQLAERTSMAKRQAMIVIDALTGIIADETEAGNTVAIHGFGKFTIKERAARMGRNPRTGEPMQFAASRSLSFKASKSAT